MYAYEWDKETGGLLLNSSPLSFSKEPRPVYYKELDILGFDQYWNYEKKDDYPYMWAEANNYWYRGKLVAKTKGGSVYSAPKLIILEDPEPNGAPLKFVDISAMVEKNRDILEKLIQDTIKEIYNIYIKFKDKVDVFYVAFSGGKDSVALLDLVQRALPHNDFKVIFGDTGMEFPDTYDVIKKIQKYCAIKEIEFYTAKSKFTPKQTWSYFGPPSTSNRWCCSVHKTAPQIILLRELTHNNNFTGMAFTGVRAAESISRSEYNIVGEGKKHQGQYSCHPILEWNSAELFLYIYTNKLMINEAYKKGNSRAGCLVCPNSSGKHEYFKRYSYSKEVDFYIDIIKSTSGKTNYSNNEMEDFINAGFWRTRKSGRELNFGQDKFEFNTVGENTVINVYTSSIKWKDWAKTIGDFNQTSDNKFNITFRGKIYYIIVEKLLDKIVFILTNCFKTKDDIKFQSLFRSVIIKSIYCIGCGVCEAECNFNNLCMKDGLSFGSYCTHCNKCHDVRGYCLRYNSIQNKITEGKKMKGMDRYFSFGIRKQWMNTYVKYKGSSDFWKTDGDGQVPNKKKDAFLNFLKDAGMVEYDKKADGDKYMKCLPTPMAETIFKLGSDSQEAWALLLVNLVYTSPYNWFVSNLKIGTSYTPDSLKFMLTDVMERDIKGLGKRNVIDALKITMFKTPLGSNQIFAQINAKEKISSTGIETISMTSIKRVPWENPSPCVILYSLYKFAEKCGEYYQFTLTRLLDHEIDSNGVSPTEIFGFNRNQMEKILNGLAINYPEFISVSFTLDLDNITLRSDKSSTDVLELF
ncbi:MAG: phosphoadenosine phosphosulfate reductase family protein [Bacillota bacterium]|jgi:phosphoadenosine phosphosulfate reductase|nr:phosphoadenosine phosphosulfate reductase family protein [Bacillota bacterium]